MSLKKTAQNNSPGQQMGGKLFTIRPEDNRAQFITQLKKPETFIQRLNLVLKNNGYEEIQGNTKNKILRNGSIRESKVNDYISNQINKKVEGICNSKDTSKQKLAKELQKEFMTYLNSLDASGNPTQLRPSIITGQQSRPQQQPRVSSRPSTYSGPPFTSVSSSTRTTTMRTTGTGERPTRIVPSTAASSEAPDVAEEELEEAQQEVEQALEEFNEAKTEQQNLASATQTLGAAVNSIHTLGSITSTGNVANLNQTMAQVLAALQQVAQKLSSAGEQNNASEVKEVAQELKAAVQEAKATNNNADLQAKLKDVEAKLEEQQKAAEKAKQEKDIEVEKLKQDLVAANKAKNKAEEQAKQAASNKEASNAAKKAAEKKNRGITKRIRC